MTIGRLLGLISFTLVSNFNLFGQTFSEQELIGTWIVNKFENQMSESEIPADQKAMMAKVGKAFGDSKFTFQPEKKCIFEFSFDEMAIENGYWKYDSISTRLVIQEWKDKDKNGAVLMGLQIIRRGEKIFFIVEETPFVLEVKKI